MTSKLDITLQVLKQFSAAKKLQAALDISKVAVEYYDRSNEVDEAVCNHFIDFVIPFANAVTKIEADAIEKCKTDLNLGEDKEKWRRMKGTVNDHVQKFKSANDDKVIIVKGVAILHEKAEVILSWMMHFVSNERINIHKKENGTTSRTSEYDYSSHTCHVTAEIKSPPPITNRKFGGYQVWQKGWEGNDETYVIGMMPDKDYSKTSVGNETSSSESVLASSVSGTPAKTSDGNATSSSETINVSSVSSNTASTLSTRMSITNSKTKSSGPVLAFTTALFVLEPLTERITRITQVQKLI